MTLISIWQEIHIFSYREMENAVPLSVFWGLNFPRNLLLSFNKHTAHSLPLKHSGNLLVQEKWSRETVFISSAKDTLVSVKDRMKLLMLIVTLCAVVPLEGNTAIIQVRPALGLLFVRKIGSNADIKKTNQDGTLFQTKGQIEAGTSASLKERRVCCIHWDKVRRCEVVSESNMQKSRNKLEQMETPGSEGQLAFIIMPSCWPPRKLDLHLGVNVLSHNLFLNTI